MHELNLLAFFSRLLFVWENRGGGDGPFAQGLCKQH